MSIPRKKKIFQHKQSNEKDLEILWSDFSDVPKLFFPCHSPVVWSRGIVSGKTMVVPITEIKVLYDPKAQMLKAHCVMRRKRRLV